MFAYCINRAYNDGALRRRDLNLRRLNLVNILLALILVYFNLYLLFSRQMVRSITAGAIKSRESDYEQPV